jgi:hypothetical protein
MVHHEVWPGLQILDKAKTLQDKRSSLFCPSNSEREKSFYKIESKGQGEEK